MVSCVLVSDPHLDVNGLRASPVSIDGLGAAHSGSVKDGMRLDLGDGAYRVSLVAEMRGVSVRTSDGGLIGEVELLARD